jgi:predicted  nucleic acid-binding Zn-ribbon protein
MANVQKEISQLEHWLNNLSDETPTNIPSQPNHSYDDHFEFSNLNRIIERLAEDVSNQRHTLNNILERLDNLEGFQRPDREVFIDENTNQHTNDPWLDNHCEPLENEVIILKQMR